MCTRTVLSWFLLGTLTLLGASACADQLAHDAYTQTPVNTVAISEEPFELIRDMNVYQADKRANQAFDGFLQQKLLMNDVVQQLEQQGAYSARR